MGKCILLVDDNAAIREVLRRTPERAEFQIAGECANGAEAVEAAPRIRPDLIILDLSMPVMNGLEAAPLIRKRLPHVPIILFTMFGQVLTPAKARAVGISAIASKADSPHNLVRSIQTLLDSANSRSAA